MKKYPLFLLILLLPCLLFSQRGDNRAAKTELIVLKGRILDSETNSPLEYATITIFSKTEQSLVNGAITDGKGDFVVKVNPGLYNIKLDFLGYKFHEIPELELKEGELVRDLGVFKLIATANSLNEVLVRGERSQLQIGLDKKIFNVGKDLSSRGGTALEILENVPSVQVDIEGNISLRGSGSVRILVDGKPSGIVGEGGSGLRAIQADMIARIEVITNPSARYEAEGMAGILNIVLKKNQQKGINGAFEATLGYPKRYGLGANMNFRANALNFFINYNITDREGPGKGNSYQEFYDGDTTLITIQDNERTRGGLSNNLRFGADYFLNVKNTLTTAFSMKISDDNNFSENFYEDYINDLDNLMSRSERTDDEKEDETKWEYSLIHKKTYDRKGQEWTTSLSYQDNVETEESDLKNQYFNPDGTPSGIKDVIQEATNTESEKQFIAKTDFVFPFSKESKFEVGGRVSIRSIKNDYLVQELNDGSWEALEGFSNIFEYDEKIYAAYLIYGNKVNNFSYQIGIRPEYTDVTTRLLTTNQVNPRDYLNVFPSGHIGCELPGNNNLQLSYSRRVRRPRFHSLNPFFTFSDDRNFHSGNPNLDPEFTHSTELNHIKYWDKASLSTGIYYRHVDDKVERIRSANPDGTTVSKPENLSTQDAFGFEFNTSFNPAKWFRFNADFNFFRSITDGKNLDEDFSADTYGWFTRGTTKFTVWKNTDLQVRFNYRSPQESTQGKYKAFYTVDFGATRDLLKDKATLTLSVRDIFNSRRWRYITEDEAFYREGDFQWRSRQMNLTFSYRLNQKKQRGGRGNEGFEGGGGM